jgi:transcriptional regulator with XRE-family HTH domain
MTIEDLRAQLGWSKRRLCEEAGIDMGTLQRAIAGEQIYRATAGKLATAFNRELVKRGESTIRYDQFEGVAFKD